MSYFDTTYYTSSKTLTGVFINNKSVSVEAGTYHYWDKIKKLPGDIYPAAWGMYKAVYFLG